MLIDVKQFGLEEILPKVGIQHSKRLQTFAKSVQCANCGVKGSFFKLQYDPLQLNAHLNLFTDKGVLMTKDHIKPVSKGGSNDQSNLQTMCAPCNMKKGDKYVE